MTLEITTLQESRNLIGELRKWVFYTTIAALIAIASFEGGFILGRWEDFDRDGKIAKHETQIEILKTDINLIKERLKIK